MILWRDHLIRIGHSNDKVFVTGLPGQEVFQMIVMEHLIPFRNSTSDFQVGEVGHGADLVGMGVKVSQSFAESLLNCIE